MWNLNLLSATRTVEAAMPFLLYRLGIYLLLALGSLLAALVGAGTLIAFASFTSNPGSVAGFGAVLGLGAYVLVLYRFRAGLFFNINAGHLALLSEMAKGEKLAQGKQQIDSAKRKAAERFPSPAGFVEISDAVKQVLKALPSRCCPYLIGLSSKPSAAILGDLAGRLSQTGSQALLALSFLTPPDNPWKAARLGLVLHYRHFGPLSKGRMVLLAFELLGLIAAYTAMLYPLESAISMLPVDVGIWRYVFALIFAWSLKAAFFEPIATAALAERYFRLASEEPDVTDEEVKELEACSDAFVKINERAA